MLNIFDGLMVLAFVVEMLLEVGKIDARRIIEGIKVSRRLRILHSALPIPCTPHPPRRTA